MDFRAGRSPDGFRDPSTLNEMSSSPLIRVGDMVVFFEGREPIGFDRMKAKTIWQCRHGAFHHDEIVGKPFGSRVFSRTTKGYVYALSPTPELWSHVVPNRTQIVQDFDQSIVIFRLDLKPGDIVVESGTGSGVMSTAIMRTIAPSGFLHSFEFNEIRATRAQEEFEENALGGLAKVAHRDVCAARVDGGGFGEELDGKADAVFLDLPEPWLAVEHAKLALKPGKKVCSYSPCIEQVMKTCEALRFSGFHSVTTIEFRLRNINYTEVQLDVPDFGCNPAASPSAPASPPAAPASEAQPASAVQASDGSLDEACAGADGEAAGAARRGRSVDAAAAGVGDGGVAEVPVTREASSRGAPAEEDGSKAGEKGGPVEDGRASSVPAAAEGAADSSIVATSGEGPSSKGNGAAIDPAAAAAAPDSNDTKKRPRDAEEGEGASDAGRGRNERLPSKAAIRASQSAVSGTGVAQKPLVKLVCAQPFPLMRGHTAFLTFATAPVARQFGAAAKAVAAGGATGGDLGTKGGNSATSLAGGVVGGGANRYAGGDMDVCEHEGAAGGKDEEEASDINNAKGQSVVAAVSDTTNSSSAAGR
ncbi:unnamed protein product [Pylaiella littoralis]